MPTPLYLPYEFTSVPMTVSNVNPFGIDPEQTILLSEAGVDFDAGLESGLAAGLESVVWRVSNLRQGTGPWYNLTAVLITTGL